MSSTDRTVRHLFCFSVTYEQCNTDTYIINVLIGTAVTYSRNIWSFTATPLCLVLTKSCFLTQRLSNFGSQYVFTGSPLAFLLVSSSVISWLPHWLLTKGTVAKHFKANGWSIKARQTWQTCNTFYHSIYSTGLIYIILLRDL